jgi:hypothetical protein
VVDWQNIFEFSRFRLAYSFLEEALDLEFTEKRLRNQKYQLTPTKRTCNGCGKIFMEWSIPIDYALKVGKNIEFCNNCYSYIFNHRFMANTTKAAQMSKKEMLDYLFKLSKALGFIPTRKYMEALNCQLILLRGR